MMNSPVYTAIFLFSSSHRQSWQHQRSRLLTIEHSAWRMPQPPVQTPALECRAPRPALLSVDSGTSTVASAPMWQHQRAQLQQRQRQRQGLDQTDSWWKKWIPNNLIIG